MLLFRHNRRDVDDARSMRHPILDGVGRITGAEDAGVNKGRPRERLADNRIVVRSIHISR